jgi:hypothetical protein
MRNSNKVNTSVFLELWVIDVSVFEFLSIHFIEFISFKQGKHWLISRIIGD